MAVRVITDSTSDLPPAMASELGIAVVPLNVHFGEEVYRDGIDIQADGFYQRLLASPRLPTTSQPSVGAFLEAYRQALEGAEAVVSVHISSRVSGTYNSAVQARGEMGDDSPIQVVDTLQASLSAGLVAVAAARAAQRGAALEEVAAIARDASSRAHLFGLLETLEYLEKGGRIGRAAAFLGSLLKIKPLLTCTDGVAHPLERLRTRARGVERLEELAREHGPLEELAVLHSTTPSEAEALAGRLQDCLPGRPITMGRFGPVVGTYFGPGAIGVALLRSAA